MLEKSIGTRSDQNVGQRERFSSQGRQVRLVILTWPVVALLGATVATATCLLKECPLTRQPAAKETLVGNVGAVKSIAIRQDGEMLTSVGVDGSMVIFDLTERPFYPYLAAESGLVRCATLSSDNRNLATGHPSATVAVHDLVERTTRPLDDKAGASAGTACLSFSPDGSTLAVGQQDGKVTLWNAATGRKRSTLDGHREFVAALTFAPDGATLASAGGDHGARIWDLSSRQQRFMIPSSENTFVAMAFSPDSRLLCLGDQVSPFVRVWDVTSGVERARLRGPSGAVVAVGISPDGTTLAAADYKGAVTFWDLATLRVRPGRLRHAGVRSVAFGPDGITVATGGFDGTIRLWDVPVGPED
jgi:WD40 repeat protein